LNAIKLLIVEDNADLRGMLWEYFSAQDQIQPVGKASNGLEALSLLEELQPDVMLLDMIMPQMDGFELLHQMQPMAHPPAVVALTALCRDDFIARAMELGVRHYMVKPFDFDLLCRRVLEAAGCQEPLTEKLPPAAPVSRARSLDERIGTLFLTVGIPAHIKGYQYLREAVKMVLSQPEMINRITKELYPGIAHTFSTTSSKVELAIRHAIEVAWSRGRIDVIDQVFGANVCSLDDKPTNGEFIALVADKLSMEQSA